VQVRAVREIRTLRARWQGLGPESRITLAPILDPTMSDQRLISLAFALSVRSCRKAEPVAFSPDILQNSIT
jgi:hypothetical protein